MSETILRNIQFTHIIFTFEKNTLADRGVELKRHDFLSNCKLPDIFNVFYFYFFNRSIIFILKHD